VVATVPSPAIVFAVIIDTGDAIEIYRTRTLTGVVDRSENFADVVVTGDKP
jgi:hypothetical protein